MNPEALEDILSAAGNRRDQVLKAIARHGLVTSPEPEPAYEPEPNAAVEGAEADEA